MHREIDYLAVTGGFRPEHEQEAEPCKLHRKIRLTVVTGTIQLENPLDDADRKESAVLWNWIDDMSGNSLHGQRTMVDGISKGRARPPGNSVEVEHEDSPVWL